MLPGLSILVPGSTFPVYIAHPEEACRLLELAQLGARQRPLRAYAAPLRVGISRAFQTQLSPRDGSLRLFNAKDGAMT